MNKIQVLITAFLLILNISCNSESACCQTNKCEIMLSDSGLSCNLTDEKLLKRKTLLTEKIFKNVDQIEELENGYKFSFQEKEGFDAELMKLIEAERSCCPFFEIKLHFLPFKKGISLEITGKEGVKEFIKTELLD